MLGDGASAVYGSDAIAGVVNFVMDDEFEGFRINAGAAGYQHDNDNGYIQGLMDERGFEYDSGNTGIDGKNYSIDLSIGGSFAEGKGHATAYAVWRRNDELLQGARDYSSCALNGAGSTACMYGSCKYSKSSLLHLPIRKSQFMINADYEYTLMMFNGLIV